MRFVRTLRRWTMLFCLEIVMVACGPHEFNFKKTAASIGKFTGLRYLTDLAMDRLGTKSNWFRGYAGSIAWKYTIRQTHRLRCAYCEWMIAPWPFAHHAYCDEMLAEENGNRTGNYSTAVASCTQCRYPISAKQVKNNSHECGPVLRPRRTIRSLIGV